MGGQGSVRRRSLAATVLAVLATVGTTACTGTDPPPGPVVVAPGAPGEPGAVLTDGPPEWSDQPHTAADVRFVHAMIAHHAQALYLTGLVPGRSERDEIGRLAQRIELSQEDEIALMEEWLQARGEDNDHAEHAGERHPGMLTDRQLAELAELTGSAFDRRFLELMIEHHEGARIMIDELFAAGGGQQAEIFHLVTHIGTDQQIEIDRMTDLLAELGAGGATA